METFNCETFTYDKDDYERDILIWISAFAVPKIKEIIDYEIKEKPKCFRTEVFRKILNQQNGKSWWIKNDDSCTPFEKEQEREILLAIWKISRTLMRSFYIEHYDKLINTGKKTIVPEYVTKYHQQAINSWFYDALEETEKKIEKGEINEQKYITICNNMRRSKKKSEDLLNACCCSAMGRQNKASIGEPDAPPTDVFKIVCLPCGFLN
jgi:hypothetical protein